MWIGDCALSERRGAAGRRAGLGDRNPRPASPIGAGEEGGFRAGVLAILGLIPRRRRHRMGSTRPGTTSTGDSVLERPCQLGRKRDRPRTGPSFRLFADPGCGESHRPCLPECLAPDRGGFRGHRRVGLEGSPPLTGIRMTQKSPVGFSAHGRPPHSYRAGDCSDGLRGSQRPRFFPARPHDGPRGGQNRSSRSRPFRIDLGRALVRWSSGFGLRAEVAGCRERLCVAPT